MNKMNEGADRMLRLLVIQDLHGQKQLADEIPRELAELSSKRRRPIRMTRDGGTWAA